MTSRPGSSRKRKAPSKPRPTAHRPGTPGKLSEMERRAAAGLPLFDGRDVPSHVEGVTLPRGVSCHRKHWTYRGVRCWKDAGRYRAKANVEGRQISVGCFASVDEAVAAINAFRVRLGVAEADERLEDWGWDVDDEDDEAEGGSGNGPWHGPKGVTGTPSPVRLLGLKQALLFDEIIRKREKGKTLAPKGKRLPAVNRTALLWPDVYEAVSLAG
jgi:hypothetical protein